MIVFGLLSAALAQDLPDAPFDAQTWRIPVDATTMVWTERAGFEPGFSTRLGTGWVNGPLVYTDTAGKSFRAVSNAWSLDAVLAFGEGPARLALDVPIYLIAAGDSVNGRTGLGDVALDAKIVGPQVGDVALALDGRIVAPTATLDAPLGDRGFGGEVAAVADSRVGDVVLAGNLGMRFRPREELQNLVLDDQLVLRLGASWLVREAWGLSGELSALPTVASLDVAAAHPVELTAGAWARLSNEWSVRGGLGRGLTKGIGSPDARATFVVMYRPASSDDDLDGVVGGDQCPLDPEDVDGFEDSDGCPEADNDADGVADLADRCPTEPEDRDAWRDDDGCADRKTLFRVSIVDDAGNPVPKSNIALAGESRMGPEYAVELDPGVYEIAISAVGFMPLIGSVLVPSGPPVAVMKRLPVAQEGLGAIHVDVSDPQGRPVETARWSIGERAPEDLRSGSGLELLPAGTWEITVAAPDYASASLNVDVKDGRATAISVVLEPFHVKITAERLELDGDVAFDTGTARIVPESYGILDEVAAVMKQRPEIKRIQVEVHTDSRGEAADNQALSEQRAAAIVKFLVEKGVDAGRLQGIGYGESRPVDPSDTPEAWARNRRVEFVVDRIAQ